MRRVYYAVMIVSVAGGAICAARNVHADPWLYASVLAHGFAAGAAGTCLATLRAKGEP